VPVDRHDVPKNHLEAWCCSCRPAEDLLVIFSFHLGQVGVVHCLQVYGNVLERLEDLDAPHSLELVHKRSSKNSLASAVAQVDEGATWDVEGVVPAVRVLILEGLLNPLEDLEERFEFDLAVGQVDIFQAALVSLTPTFSLAKKCKDGSDSNS